MPYCQKCGAEVREDMAFCPRCGVTLTIETPSVEAYGARKAEKPEKHEKEEKREKGEKGEKAEKQERREGGIVGSLAGGSILILAGFLFYLAVTGHLDPQVIGPLLLIAVGIIVVLGVVYGVRTAAKRHPRP